MMSNEDVGTHLRERFEPITYDRSLSDIRVGVSAHRRRRRWGMSIGGGVLAIAALIAVLVLAPSGGSAIAGWTPEPRSADEATLARAEPVCRQALSPMYASAGPVEWTDMRGNGLVLVFRPEADLLLTCQLVIESDSHVPLGGGAGPVALSPQSGVVQIDGIIWSTGENGGTTVVIGQASPDVDHVIVSASDWIATASSHDRYWLAWWPAAIAHESEVSVAAFDGNGTRIGPSLTP